jgi:CheY-like chemotaxis protein
VDGEVKALIVVAPGRLRDGLRTVLTGLLPTTAIETAADGGSALAILDKQAPDLVLIDAHLSDMNGLQLVRRLKDCGSPARFIVLAATLEQQAAAQACDADTVLLWGFGGVELLAAVQRLLPTCHCAPQPSVRGRPVEIS